MGPSVNRHGAAWRTELVELGFRGDLRPDAPLAPLTTWRIGGPAELLATPSDREISRSRSAGPRGR